MVRKLLGSIREYTKDTWLTPLFLLGEVAMEVVIPLFMAELIDQGITGGQMNQVVKYGLILVLFALVSLVFGVLAGKHSAIAMAGFGKTCAMTCSVMYSSCLTPIWTNFQPLAS